jgi:cytochrome P450
MSAALFELSHNSRVLNSLRHEVEGLQGRLPNYEDIKNMKYLEFVMKEALRLHPPVPLNSRVACNDTFIPRGGGADGKAPVFVENGKMIVYQVYSMHRRPDLWGADANEFRPERWETARPMFAFLPFNAGPRVCPGKS